MKKSDHTRMLTLIENKVVTDVGIKITITVLTDNNEVTGQ